MAASEHKLHVIKLLYTQLSTVNKSQRFEHRTMHLLLLPKWLFQPRLGTGADPQCDDTPPG